jgi:hypothetical protein
MVWTHLTRCDHRHQLSQINYLPLATNEQRHGCGEWQGGA